MKNIFSFLPSFKPFCPYPILIIMLIAHCFLLIEKPAFSQKILLYQNVQKDSIIPKWGPNRKNFISLFIGLGAIAGKHESGASVIYSKSSEFTIGINYKYRFTNHEAIGFKLSYDLDNYRLKPNTAFDSTNSILHKKEKFAFNSFSLALYNRINFDKRRGNYLGHYLDIGVYGSWFFSIRHYTKDEINGITVKTYMSHLPYTENVGYDAFINLGFNQFIIYSKYRISRFFKESYGLPSLSRYILGINFNLFK